ncbi:hypothetical protein EDB89DRAFT_2076861 [Lactarius sanguifluus]|nr:hypothetical protein EDB89DRAFT_2076861 [Lactarius sanguifluus]
MQWPNKKAKHDGQKGKETARTGTGVSGGLPQANFKDIIVRPSASNLIDVITNDFLTVSDAADLLRAMHDATDCETCKPSNDDLQGGQGVVYHKRAVLYDVPGQQLSRTIVRAAPMLLEGRIDTKHPPSKSKPTPKPKPAPSKPKATPSKPKAAPSKSQAGPSNSSGTAPAVPAEPSPTKPSGAKAGLSKTKAGPSKSAKCTKPAATNSPTKPAPKQATRSHMAKAHRSAPMDQDDSTSLEASSEG